MEALRKLVALLATITLLLLSLLSGLISATSADDAVKNEVVSSGMEEASPSTEGVEPEEVVLETDGEEEALGPEGGVNQEDGEDVGEGDEPGEGAGLENPAGLGEEATTDEEENPPAAEGGESGKVNDGGAGMESGQDASPPASDDTPPNTAVSPLPTPQKSLDGDNIGSDVPAPEVSPLVIYPYTSVTPETIDPWQSGNAQNECAGAGCSCPYAYKIDEWAEGGDMDGIYDTGVGNKITISNDNGYTFDWSSEWPVCCVIVKGGTGANIFRYSGSYGDAGLYAPFRPAGSPGTPTYGISHVTFCFGNPPDDDGSICGTKWEDLDCDGKHDRGEPAVPGVTIELYDSEGKLVFSTVTDEEGKYRFASLALGKYTVKEILEKGWFAKNPSDGEQCVVLWCMKPWACNVDFINARLGRICGFKFDDRDCDGRWDCGEPKLKGVTIELWREGALKATAVTDEDGAYSFENLEPGNYWVKEIVGEGWHPTTPNPAWVKLKCGEEEKVKFGNTRLGTIHGYKFLDADCDGEMDEGEEGIPGVRVKLFSICGVRETWTDEEGHYSFEGLWPGLYKVVLDTSTVPAGHYHTTDTWKLLWLCCCETDRVDFGNARYLSISGTKLDCYEDPVPGVLIELWQGCGMLDSDITDENGEYYFGNLMPGTYTVKEVLSEEQLDEWYVVYPEGGAYEDLQLTCGQDIEDLNFINARYGSICGAKYEDLDGDGILDEGEPPVAGVSIQLWRLVEANGDGAIKTLVLQDGEWTLEGETATGEDGSYCFGGLKPGTYRVVEALAEEQLEEWFPVSPEDGIHDGVELACGENIEDLDFLNARYGSITGHKFEDLDGDGLLDEGEPGFEGVTIQLKRDGGVVDAAVTDAEGAFSFSDVEPGTYDIEELLDVGVYTKASTVITGVVAISGQETVLEGEFFLNYRRGSITGYKYLDANANGSLDPGEKPWDGSANPVTIELVRDGAVLREFVIKDDDGMYFFGDLEPGEYTVREALPLPAGMTSKALTSLTVLVTSGADVVVDPEGYFLNYFETEVAPEVITPPTTPQVQPEIVGQLPTTGADYMPLFLVAGMLLLLGAIALTLGVLRMRRA